MLTLPSPFVKERERTQERLMKKVLTIGWKDVTLAFRDRAALILMLLAPFALTLGMGFVTGRFSGSNSSGLSRVPIVIVNQDEGALGAALVDVFESEDLAQLLEPAQVSDTAEARKQVELGEASAAVIIPSGFTAGILPDQTGRMGEAVAIEVYSDPGSPIGAGVVQSIVDTFVSRVETGRIGAEVAIGQLIANGLIAPQDAARIGAEIGARAATQDDTPLIGLTSEADAHVAARVDVLAFLAPGMALTFLMYTVSRGGASILAERSGGTLPRLLTTPTSAMQVLGGKMIGIYATGVAQMGILILATTVMFQLKWGDPLGLIALVLAVAAAATGWGILLASLAKTPNQVGNVGAAMMLAFSVLGGNFVGGWSATGVLQTAGWITPNYWGQEGFNRLARGGTIADLVPSLAVMLIIAVVLFVAAVMFFRRKGIAQR